MNQKTTSILSYISLIGWLIAYFVGDREGAKFHLNQALVLYISMIINSFLMIIPLVSLIALLLNLVLLVFWIMGLVYACQQQEKELPLIGKIKILK